MKGALIKRRVGTVKAVNGLSFDIREGECFSIVGESGCGKTTTLLEIMEFNKNTDGEILINGTSTKDGKSAGEILELRKNPADGVPGPHRCSGSALHRLRGAC